MLTDDADPGTYRCYNWIDDPTDGGGGPQPRERSEPEYKSVLGSTCPAESQYIPVLSSIFQYPPVYFSIKQYNGRSRWSTAPGTRGM